MRIVTREQLVEWNQTWSLAVVFGLASIPWTYGFVAGLHIPLWPAFIASGTFYAVGEGTDGIDGLDGLVRGYASNFAGIGYAAVTLGLVNSYFGGGILALSLVVGAFMFLASLHDFVPLLSFTPGAFFGFATMFGVHAAEATAFGFIGLPGEVLAAIVSMFIGALIGFATAEMSFLFVNNG